MNNFLDAGRADLGPLRLALKQKQHLWDQHPYRTRFEGTPFAGMNDIILRYSRPEKINTTDPLAMVNDTDLVMYPAWKELPEAHQVVFDLMRRYKGVALGRVIIANLMPGERIALHADDYGDYAMRPEGLRFHACVYAHPGCHFQCGTDVVQMKTDEVWWFNHRQPHAALNASDDQRIHLLVDIETA